MKMTSKVFKVAILVITVFIFSIFVSMAAGGAAGEMDKVTLRTNWLFYGSHSVFFLGIDKGYYADENIDLIVRQGNGSGNAVRLVANKDDTFAYAASASMIGLVAQGAPIISVVVIDAEGVDAVLCRPDSGILEFKDLEGKKVMTTAGAGVNTFFSVACKNAGVDISKIELINVAESAIVTSYLEGLAPAILGGIDDKPAQIVANGGEQPIIFNYADYGVYQPGYSIVVNKDTLEKNPDLVRRFVKATLRAVKAAEADPDASIASLLKWAGGAAVDEKQARQVLDVTLSILYSSNNTSKILGLNVEKDWESALSLLKEYTELKTDMSATDFYTNDYLPK